MVVIMFNGFSQHTIDFMWNLRFNNRRDWFEAHKEEYKRELLSPMKDLSGEVFERVTERCGDRGFIHKVSRIYKDARRVRDGEPYRTHLWFSIERPSEDWTFSPVFWFQLEPDEWSYGLGYWQAKPITMAKLRARIDANPKKFESLISSLAEQNEFVLDGPEYARRKTAPTLKTQAWYNKKSFSLTYSQPNGKELFSSAFADRLVYGYEFLMPLYDYIATLDSDPEPKV